MKIVLLIASCPLLWCPLHCPAQPIQKTTSPPSSLRFPHPSQLSAWDFSIRWKGTFLSIIDGGLDQNSTFEQELSFDSTLDLGQLFHSRLLTGLSLFGGVRWRDGYDANQYAGASPSFNPALFQSGKGWRLMPFGLSWKFPTPKTARTSKPILEIAAGWLNPYTLFLDQPGSKFFRNNMIVSSKGITPNGVGWSSSYTSWGGFLKIRPTQSTWLSAGLFTAIPKAFDSANHGLHFSGAKPASQNGLFALGEVGISTNPHSMPGRYALGSWFWGLKSETFLTHRKSNGRWGLYCQADQMIFKEHPSPNSSPADSQGLSLISLFSFAPPDINTVPLYFHIGAIYKGLIPSRNADQFGIAFAFAEYSHDLIRSEHDLRLLKVHDYEAALEFDYRIQLNQFSSLQPFLQYLIRPGGQNRLANATILGINLSLEF